MTQLTSRLPRVAEIIHEGIQRGLHLGVQCYVSRDGHVLVDDALGEVRPGQPLSADNILPWLSAGKPATAVLIAQLVERGALNWNDHIVRFIPEFAAHAKDSVTVRHLLTHTAGLAAGPTGWPQRDWNGIIQHICDSSLRPDWTPGLRAAYDPQRSWFILGELIRRIEGRPVDALIRELFVPLGGEAVLAWSREEYEAVQSRVAPLYAVVDGMLRPTHGHSFDVSSHPSPGGSLRGPARALGRFYEALLASLGPTAPAGAHTQPLLLSATLTDITSRWRRDLFDETFLHKVDFGGGIIVNSNRYGARTIPYGFGEHCSPDTFGHGGAQSSIGFADPQHGLVAVVIANGCPGEPQHNRRNRRINSAIYEDLGLAG